MKASAGSCLRNRSDTWTGKSIVLFGDQLDLLPPSDDRSGWLEGGAPGLHMGNDEEEPL